MTSQPSLVVSLTQATYFSTCSVKYANGEDPSLTTCNNITGLSTDVEKLSTDVPRVYVLIVYDMEGNITKRRITTIFAR